MTNYVATIRVLPVVDNDKAFVEWSATFDCPADEHDRWTRYYEQEGFAKWLAALRCFMARDDADRDVRREAAANPVS